MPDRCATCSAELDGAESRFCSDCGASVLVPVEPALAQAAQAAPAGAPAALDIVILDAAGLPQATASRSPAAATGMPLRLEVNRNRFYMAGRSGVLELRVSNELLDRDVVVACRVDGEFCQARPAQFALPARAARVIRLSARPLCSGEVLVDVALQTRCGDEMAAAFAGQYLVRVLEPNVAPQHLSINIDQSLRSQGDIMGASVRSQAQDLIQKGLIRTNNDLLEQQFAEQWDDVQLYPTDLSCWTAAPDAVVRVVPPARPLASRADRLRLSIDDAWVPERVLVVARDRVRLGRQRETNDIVLRALPKSPENDAASARISREQILIALEPDGVFLYDVSSAQSTRLDGRPVGRRAMLRLDRPSDVHVADVLSLRIRPCEASGAESDSRYRLLGEPDDTWHRARALGIRSLVIERANNFGEKEVYLVVYQYICIGRGTDNEICVAGAELEDRHARLLRVGQRFWFENTARGANLALHGQEIPPASAGVVEAGTGLQFGSIGGRIERYEQVGL